MDGLSKQSLGIAAVFLLAASAGLATNIEMPNIMNNEVQPSEAVTGDSVEREGVVSMALKRDTDGDGDREVIEEYKSHNIIVDQGLDVAECYFSGVSCPNGFDSSTDQAIYIAVGNNVGTLGAGNTSLENEITTGGLSRNQGSVIDLGVGNYSVSTTFTATTSFNGVNATGLMWNNTAGSASLVAANKFQGVDMLADDQLTINWTRVSFQNAP